MFCGGKLSKSAERRMEKKRKIVGIQKGAIAELKICSQ